jgi:ligand-binding sensor domain-containing protein/serine phosphatase RsbU (regulator of sigma subunit)
MKITFLTLIILCIGFSCTQQEESDYQLPNPQPKVVKTNGYIVPKDSITDPKIIKVDKSKLKVVKVGKPKVIATNTNIHLACKPKIVKAGKPIVIKIGSDTFFIPKKVKAIGKVVQCKMPKPEKTVPPYMKDNALSNMKCMDMDHMGFQSSYVNDIFEDNKGNLWFATMGAGVSKYDGEAFLHFTENEGLLSNSITFIFQDKKGDLWFGTRGYGVCKYNGEFFTNYTEKEGLGNNWVTRILEDKKGNLWFATFGGGVTKYDGTHFTNYTTNEGLSNNIVSSLLEDRFGNIWFGTYEGVSIFDGFSFKHFTEKEGLSKNMVWSILEDNKGNIWIGTNGGGVNKYEPSSKIGNNGNFTHYTEKEGLSQNKVWSILQDKIGNLWFGTYNGGVSKFEPPTKKFQFGSFIHLTENEGLTDNMIWSILQDKSGNIWFGTCAGISIYLNQSFDYYTVKQGLPDKQVETIFEDKLGNLWLGTFSGLTKYDGSSFTSFSQNEGLINNRVFSIEEDKNGNMWFSQFGGISKYNGKTFTHYLADCGLGHYMVTSIIMDKNGILWLATNGGGAIKFDEETFTNYTTKEGLSSNYINNLLEDKKGNLWFGTQDGGVCKYDGETFSHYTKKQGLNSNCISCIQEDNNEEIWIGTDYGLSNLKLTAENGNSGTLTHFTEKEGLSNNWISSILEVPSDNTNVTNLFIATGIGLSNLTIKSNEISNKKIVPKQVIEDSYHLISLKKKDGLKCESFSINTALIDNKGNAWWGSDKALMKMKIKKYKYPSNPPKLQMNYLAINENYIDFRNLTDSLKDCLKLNGITFKKVAPFYNYPLNLVLPHNLSHLTFNLSAIDWAAPHKIQYQYKLVGLDKKWSELSHEQKADYRNIPFGKFTFKVRAIGVAGKWSNTFEYSFVINPPWWQTWWAYGLYIITAISFIFYYIKWREKLLKKRQLELEQTVDERTHELLEEKKLVEHQKEIVEEKQKEILDSIEYAKRIQATILPSVRVVKKYLEDSFILYLPKDIVAGDFYWMESIQLDNIPMKQLYNESRHLIYFAACDCTGHGVPGAMVSVVCHNALNKALKEFGKRTPSEILDKVAELVIEDLNKNADDDDEIKDGMDASLCALDTDTGKLQWAGANNPLWLIRKGQALEETKADKQPVGRSDERHPYTNHEFQLQKGDVIYLITDGYADQFGGEKNRKFQKNRLKDLLFSMHQLPMDVQRNKLYDAFINWRRENEQVDDVCIIGVRI